MTMWTARQLIESVAVRGYGIHMGVMSTVTLRPRERGVILRRGKSEPQCVPLKPDSYASTRRSSGVFLGAETIGGPEHLFGSLSLLGVFAANIDLRGAEFPVGPSSGLSYFATIEPATAPDPEPLRSDYGELRWQHEEGRRAYDVEPAQHFSCRVDIDLGSGVCGTASWNSLSSSRSDRQAISRSRTWIDSSRLNEFLRAGLCRGLRHAPSWSRVLELHDQSDHLTLDECARHKLLDVLGDLYALGRWPAVSIHAWNPNHRLNQSLLRQLAKG